MNGSHASVKKARKYKNMHKKNPRIAVGTPMNIANSTAVAIKAIVVGSVKLTWPTINSGDTNSTNYVNSLPMSTIL